ncbi:protein phosphatase 1 regulatory subunit 36-like [Episyrphus balteatus]|uniref:protein phosphatase 1 regulatory subunit 36-like n=1 Tax=Episyrphus balteatus TaxID=286459 RepID=UPI002486B7F9|nr:protein phosphatase 1 regulatory subunit 36-like [Episyrphus balteatus]
MIRIHKDSVVPKYSTGKWSWNPSKDELNFLSWEGEILERELTVQSSSGYKFKSSINQIEEVIFRQEFARSTDIADDGDIIRIEDIKNLVLFLAPSEILTNKFITFIHNKTIDRFLNALIIYFEYFLRLVEFILIRRDEVSGETTAQVQSTESSQIKRIFSEYLSQYRIILAREYSVIVMGNGEMAPFYHLNTLVKISKTHQDRLLHEMFLAFANQVVWIAHHRKAYQTIDEEMNRLFRSDHFKLTRKELIKFSLTEQELLYGKNNQRVNYRRQNSPLIQEISNVSRRNMPILWLGEKKYRGNDLRMQQLELEFIIPDSDLCLIDVKHGILGNPMSLYNTMLTIDEEKLRERGHSESYDPFWLIRQPYLEIPKLDAIKERSSEQLESYFLIKDNRFKYDKNLIAKWKRRDKVIEYIKSGGLVIDVVERCKKELASNRVIGSNIAGITQAFIARKKFLRKK